MLIISSLYNYFKRERMYEIITIHFLYWLSAGCNCNSEHLIIRPFTLSPLHPQGGCQILAQHLAVVCLSSSGFNAVRGASGYHLLLFLLYLIIFSTMTLLNFCPVPELDDKRIIWSYKNRCLDDCKSANWHFDVVFIFTMLSRLFVKILLEKLAWIHISEC